jgi:hypothetical protein
MTISRGFTILFSYQNVRLGKLVKPLPFQGRDCEFEPRTEYQVSVSGGSERNKIPPIPPIRLSVRTLGFQPKKTSSTLVWVTGHDFEMLQ